MLSSGLCASVPAALLGSALLTVNYVACLYICASHFRVDGGHRRAPDRDDPRVIKERFARVGIACLLSPLVALSAAALPGRPVLCTISAPLARWFGLMGPPGGAAMCLLAATLPLALTMILFTGPLVMMWLDRDQYVPLSARMSAMFARADLRTVRNLVVGPISEEWVFRACMCSLLTGAGLSDGTAVPLTAAAKRGILAKYEEMSGQALRGGQAAGRGGAEAPRSRPF